MPPQNHEANMYSDSDYPTSPWTEAFRPVPAEEAEQAKEPAKHAYDSDAQKPTHDALSDIYNRGYWMSHRESAFLFCKPGRKQHNAC